MKNCHRFFSNPECGYFPCHEMPDNAHFNCLFCYCPLYLLGDKCGGNFTYSAKGVKICMGCHLPHTPEYYDVIVAKIMEVNAMTGASS